MITLRIIGKRRVYISHFDKSLRFDDVKPAMEQMQAIVAGFVED